jgi:molecular chaperone GrpE
MSDETNAQPNLTPENAADAGIDVRDVIDGLQTELAKAREDVLRAMADAENTRRRAQREAQDARTYAIDRFASDLLPIADTLGRALQAAPRDSSDEAVKNLLTGLELTERALVDAFSRHGLKRVGAIGETFDPKLHQAVAQAPSAHPAGVVAEVMQPGYVLGERTVRAAMVLVSSGQANAGASASTVDIKV